MFSCRVCLLFVRRIKAISCSSFSPPLLLDGDLSLLGEGSRGRSTLHPLFFSSFPLPLAAKHPLIYLYPFIAEPICCIPDNLIVVFVLAAVLMYGRGNSRCCLHVQQGQRSLRPLPRQIVTSLKRLIVAFRTPQALRRQATGKSRWWGPPCARLRSDAPSSAFICRQSCARSLASIRWRLAPSLEGLSRPINKLILGKWEAEI